MRRIAKSLRTTALAYSKEGEVTQQNLAEEFLLQTKKLVLSSGIFLCLTFGINPLRTTCRCVNN